VIEAQRVADFVRRELTDARQAQDHRIVGGTRAGLLRAGQAFEDQPILVNEDPYEDGWLVELEVRDEEEIEDLIDADEYDELIAEEAEDEDE